MQDLGFYIPMAVCYSAIPPELLPQEGLIPYPSNMIQGQDQVQASSWYLDNFSTP